MNLKKLLVLGCTVVALGVGVYFVTPLAAQAEDSTSATQTSTSTTTTRRNEVKTQC